MPTNHQKLRNALLYFLHHANDRTLGRTKLMKLIYFLDFEHLRLHGTVVTGAKYKKFSYGPVAVDALDELTSLDSTRQIREFEVITTHGSMYRYEPLTVVDLSVFSESELELLERLSLEWRGRPTDDAVKASHDDYPWNAVDLHEEIPLRSALLTANTRSLSPNERDAMINAIITSQWLEGVTLGYEDVARIVDDVYDEPLADIG